MMNKANPLPDYLSQQQDEETEVGYYWNAIAVSKWRIFNICFLALCAALLYLLLAPPVYQTYAMLQLKTSSSLDPLTEVSKLLDAQNVEALAEIEIIRSRNITGKVVEQLKLNAQVQPHYFPLIGAAFARRYKDFQNPAPPLWGLEQYAWGGERITVENLKVPAGYEGETLTLIALGDGKYHLMDPEDRLLLEGKVGDPEKTAVSEGQDIQVEITVTELFARKGTEFLLEVIPFELAVMDLQEQLTASEKGKQTGIIQISLEGNDPERITQIVNATAQVYVRQDIENKLEEVKRMLDFVNGQLPVLKAKLDVAETDLNTHHLKYGGVDIDLETRTLLGNLAEIERKISSLELVQVDYDRKYTREHSRLESLRRQIEQLKKERDEINKRINALPEAELKSVRIMRDVKTAGEVYSLMLTKAQELNIAKAGIVGNVRIVDSAVKPIKPVKPNKLLVMALAFSMGLFLGVFWALLRMSMHSSVDSPDIIEQRLNLSVYAIIPHSKRQVKLSRSTRKSDATMPKVLSITSPSDLAVENLRNLRTSLQFALMDTVNPVIAINGPTPNVGKSFIAVNLSYILADVGKRVLLVDGDLRRGRLHDWLLKDQSPGLSEVVIGECELENAIYNIEVTSGQSKTYLSFLPRGTSPPNPSEILMNERFQEVLDIVSDQFDMVLIDTPPVIAVTDAAIIGRMAGTNFLVVRAGQQLFKEVEMSIKRFYQSGAMIQGVILNDVPMGVGYGGYRYRYKYKYGYYGYGSY